MTHLTYAVVLCGRDWTVVGPRGRIGSFGKTEEALLVGSRLVLQGREAGFKVELLLQNRVGELLPFSVSEDAVTDLALRQFSGREASGPQPEFADRLH